MAEITLTGGGVSLVDDEDAERLARYKWARSPMGYAQRYGRDGTVMMHREILGLLPGVLVDHIDGNRLDNRKANLRPCTHQQNMMNRGPNKRNKSGYKGVYWYTAYGQWKAEIRINNKVRFLGHFDDVIEAARAYNRAAHDAFGEFAYQNPIPA